MLYHRKLYTQVATAGIKGLKFINKASGVYKSYFVNCLTVCRCRY